MAKNIVYCIGNNTTLKAGNVLEHTRHKSRLHYLQSDFTILIQISQIYQWKALNVYVAI